MGVSSGAPVGTASFSSRSHAPVDTPQRGEPVIRDDDAGLLLEHVRNTRDVMIDKPAAHAKGCFVMHHVVRSFKGWAGFAGEPSPTRKEGALPATVHADFARVDHQLDLVTMHHVPGIGAQLVFDLCKKVGAAKHHDASLAPEHHAQETIEAGKMVH